ncbi:MAG: tetratricopeptide repeat protein [Deltaproteobacteria bacterium]|nr:tetratricopeptide repeat protein [Deltaproteobacteria bacterium]
MADRAQHLATEIAELERRVAEELTERRVDRLVELYLEADKGVRAVALCQQAVEHFPESAAMRLLLATALRRVGELREASAAISQALRLDPHDAKAYRLAAALLIERQRGADALALLQLAIERNVDKDGTLRVLAEQVGGRVGVDAVPVDRRGNAVAGVPTRPVGRGNAGRLLNKEAITQRIERVDPQELTPSPDWSVVGRKWQQQLQTAVGTPIPERAPFDVSDSLESDLPPLPVPEARQMPPLPGGGVPEPLQPSAVRQPPRLPKRVGAMVAPRGRSGKASALSAEPTAPGEAPTVVTPERGFEGAPEASNAPARRSPATVRRGARILLTLFLLLLLGAGSYGIYRLYVYKRDNRQLVERLNRARAARRSLDRMTLQRALEQLKALPQAQRNLAVAAERQLLSSLRWAFVWPADSAPEVSELQRPWAFVAARSVVALAKGRIKPAGQLLAVPVHDDDDRGLQIVLSGWLLWLQGSVERVQNITSAHRYGVGGFAIAALLRARSATELGDLPGARRAYQTVSELSPTYRVAKYEQLAAGQLLGGQAPSLPPRMPSRGLARAWHQLLSSMDFKQQVGERQARAIYDGLPDEPMILAHASWLAGEHCLLPLARRTFERLAKIRPPQSGPLRLLRGRLARAVGRDAEVVETVGGLRWPAAQALRSVASAEGTAVGAPRSRSAATRARAAQRDLLKALRGGRLADAAAALQRASLACAAFEPLEGLRGLLMAQAGDYRSALPRLQAAAKHAPDQVQLQAELLVAQLMLGKQPTAAAFEAFEQLANKQRRWRRWVNAVRAVAVGDAVDANKLLLRCAPSLRRDLLLIGLEAERKVKQAIARLKRLGEQHADDPRPVLHLAELLAKGRQRKDAQAAYLRAIRVAGQAEHFRWVVERANQALASQSANGR